MAIDSRDKRSSAVSMGRPFVLTGPVADGDIASTGDRQHMAFAYRAVEAEEIQGVGVMGGGFWGAGTFGCEERLWR